MSDLIPKDLIHVAQLPVIEEKLYILKNSIEQEVAEAEKMVCTADTVQAVKSKRADLRKQLDYWEQRRKAVKAEVMKPYNQFDAVYDECVKNAYQRADESLKRKIDDTENEIKRQCEDGLRNYFDELCVVNHVEWLEYEMAGVKVDMASAKQKTPKKLRDQLKQFVERVSAELSTISKMDNANQVLAAYKGTLDLATALEIVQDYNSRLEMARKDNEAYKEQSAIYEESKRKVEALAPPLVQEPLEFLRVTFTVTDTRDRLVALREWMKAEGYKYDS